MTDWVRRCRLGLAILVLAAVPAPAQAEWLEASSPNFLVYADQDEDDVRAFTDMLERYRSAMRVLYKLPPEATSPSNRLTVFAVRDAAAVRKLLGGGSQFIQGFYQSRAGASVAYIPRVDGQRRRGRLSDGELVLLHEYAHHFMYSVFSGSAPLWFTEGFAEFYASAKFEKDGSVGLGLPANHRVGELYFAVDVPLDMLLNTRKYRENASKRYDSFYGRSWLLVHYLMMSGKRPGQLNDYLGRLNAGEGEEAAAVNAFGDLSALDKELDGYIKSRKMTYMNLRASQITSAPITIRPLRKAEAAILPVVMRSRRGVNEEEAKDVLQDARKIAAEYPEDPFVLTALAEAEYDAGNSTEALAAADKAIGHDPQSVNALVQRIYALFRQAEDADDDTMWPKVRAAVADANRVENDNPIPLRYFYQTFAAEGKTPPPVAIQGLQKALLLAPYDTRLRLTLARYQIGIDDKDAARQTLGPLINHPHDTRLADFARQLLTGEPEPAADDEPVAATPEEATQMGASPDAS